MSTDEDYLTPASGLFRIHIYAPSRVAPPSCSYTSDHGRAIPKDCFTGKRNVIASAASPGLGTWAPDFPLRHGLLFDMYSLVRGQRTGRHGGDRSH